MYADSCQTPSRTPDNALFVRRLLIPVVDRHGVRHPDARHRFGMTSPHIAVSRNSMSLAGGNKTEMLCRRGRFKGAVPWPSREEDEGIFVVDDDDDAIRDDRRSLSSTTKGRDDGRGMMSRSVRHTARPAAAPSQCQKWTSARRRCLHSHRDESGSIA